MRNEIRDPQTYAIIGAAMAVHGELGHGFLEAVYQEALAMEFETLGIPFNRECLIPISYKGRTLSCGYRADFVCFDNTITEIKDLSQINSSHEAQIIHYLKATGMPKGVLLNFGAKKLEYKRFVGPANLNE